MVKISARGIADWVEATDKEQERMDGLRAKALELKLKYGADADEDLAAKAALMSQIKARLPENSKIVPQLVGADLKTLQAFNEGQVKIQDYYAEEGLPYGPEQAEEDVISFHREVMNSGGKLSQEEILTLLGVDEDMASEIAFGGKTFEDVARSISGGKEDVGIAFQFTSPQKSLSGSEQKALKELYIGNLRPTIAAELQQINADIAGGNAGPEIEARAAELERALTGLEAGDYVGAAAIAGPEAAINLMETNPKLRPYNYLVNQRLNFPRTPEGNALFERAIKSGLLGEGDKYMSNGQMGTVTREQIERIMG